MTVSISPAAHLT